jgi:hypothetical protein
LALASATEQPQNDGPLGAKTSYPRQDVEFDDIETQNDFLGAIWDIPDESGAHIDLSMAQSSVSKNCPETLELRHSSNFATSKKY